MRTLNNVAHDVGSGYVLIRVAKHAVFLTKATKRLLNHVQYIKEFHRIEVTVRVDFPQAVRWAELLGFEYEGTRAAYDTDKMDHIVYRRVSRE